MTNIKYESIWKLISEFTFNIDFSSINEDPICVICGKIIIDVYQSECGCKYCYKCIKNYLSNDKKYCPGRKEECQEEYLVMEKCVIRNKMMNNKISKMKVQCPIESCELFEELSNMESHIQSCNKQTIECPYIMIGCNKVMIPKDIVLAHLQDDNFQHAQLLMEYIQNLKNEINILKNKVKNNKDEIILLKNESWLKKVQIEEQRKEIVSLRNNAEFKKSLKNDVIELQKCFETNKSAMTSLKKELEKIKAQRDKQRIQINNLKVKSKKETNVVKMKESLKEIDFQLSQMKVEMEKKDKLIAILQGQVKALRKDLDTERDVMLMMKTGVDRDSGSFVNEVTVKRESVEEMMNCAIVNGMTTALTKAIEVQEKESLIAEEVKVQQDNVSLITSEMDVEQEKQFSMRNDVDLEHEEVSLMINEVDVEPEGVSMIIEEINIPERNVSLEKDLIYEEHINMMTKKRKHDDGLERRVNEWINSCPNTDVDFAWKVTDISKKIKVPKNQRTFSNSFYSHGYKLCLYLRFSGDNIGLYCLINKGENDDMLQWPMRLAVSLSIEDQHCLKPFKTATLRYDNFKPIDEASFHRPKKEYNDRSIREYPFLTYSSIKDSPSIIVNDSIVISCVLSDT